MKTKLTITNIKEWLTANAESFKNIETRINATGMCVSITNALNEIAMAVDDDALEMATCSLRVAVKDGMYFANPSLKSDINKLLKLIN
jgi:hypothetical protein